MLRENEERLCRCFELELIGMAITSPTRGIIEVNDKICEILGYERQELLQKTWIEMTHPDDLAAEIANSNRVMVGEIDGYSVEKRWVRKNGSVITSTISVKCLRQADGSVDSFVTLLEDITERKHAEESLRQTLKNLTNERQRLYDVLEALPPMICLLTPDHYVEPVEKPRERL
ncbi:MAG: putative diguanylate cyclase YegE [Syntrophorhabdus sp. PtaU1.Bin050]|nr:MAG: putative diguanylate cyclase YegE [Syntrophorhabdus sp. PtaU1.Bin050]